MYWTNYAEGVILRTFLGITATAPQQMYAAAFLSNPGESGGGTEIAYPGYERMPITFSPPAQGGSGMAIANVQDVAFHTSQAAAGTITHFALYDSQLGGNAWAYVQLDEPITVNGGVAPLLIAQEWNYESIGNFSNAFKAKALNLLRGVDLPGFSPYMALFAGNPDTGGAELAGGAYARFPVTFSTPAVQPSGQSMIATTEDVASNRSTSNWGTWAYTAIMDAAGGGSSVAYAKEANPTIMGPGKAALITAGALSVSLN